MALTSPTAVVRVVSYAICGALLGTVPAFIAKESFLSPGWDEGFEHFGKGLSALLIGVAGGATGAILGALLARRQLRQEGAPPRVHPALSLPVLGIFGAFLGSVVAAGIWGAVVVGGLLVVIGILAAQ